MNIAKILELEKESHGQFFGVDIDLTKFATTLERYRERLTLWQSLGLEPHFLPALEMNARANFPGWRERPHPNFFRAAAKGAFFYEMAAGLYSRENTLQLGGRTVLLDMRGKPQFDEGLQNYADDNLLGPLLKSLRESEQISHFINPQSRFRVSSRQWEASVKSALAKKLGVPSTAIRLERIIEANVIPQLYFHCARNRDAKSDTWVWHEEFYPQINNRTCGLSSVRGGYQHLTWCRETEQLSFLGLRPIINL